MSAQRQHDAGHFATLFVELTGHETIEQHQEAPHEHDVSEAYHEVQVYVSRATRETGLDDVIEPSESF